MQKKIICVISFLFYSLSSISQSKADYVTKEIEGFFIWEMKYDSLLKVSYSDAMYLNIDTNRYAIIGPMATVAKVCNNKKLKKLYKRSLRLEKKDPLYLYYDVFRDTSTASSSGYLTMGGSFYENERGNVCLAYKVKAKVLIFKSLCPEFENSKSLRSHCGTYFTGPYTYILKSIQTEKISLKDLEQFGWSISRVNKIHWVECH